MAMTTLTLLHDAFAVVENVPMSCPHSEHHQLGVAPMPDCFDTGRAISRRWWMVEVWEMLKWTSMDLVYLLVYAGGGVEVSRRELHKSSGSIVWHLFERHSWQGGKLMNNKAAITI